MVGQSAEGSATDCFTLHASHFSSGVGGDAADGAEALACITQLRLYHALWNGHPSCCYVRHFAAACGFQILTRSCTA
jgi:hypothetical protein